MLEHFMGPMGSRANPGEISTYHSKERLCCIHLLGFKRNFHGGISAEASIHA